jgi:hypothetical protein
MEKFAYISYLKRTFIVCIAIAITVVLPLQARAANILINVDTTQNADSTADDYDINAANVTFTNNADISFAAGSTIDINTQTGVTIINNAGSTISTAGDLAIDANIAGAANNLTIINSGTISADGARGIRLSNGATGFSLTNNSGASISGKFAAINMSGAIGTITNSGTMSSGGGTIQTGTTANAATIINTASGVIKTTSLQANDAAVKLEGNDTYTNSGEINNTAGGNSIRLNGNNNTVTLKEGGIVVGDIVIVTGNTGNTLKIDQGFGQSYFYSVTDPDGNLALQDLSGNKVVKGSAGSVGQGANESIDELLGLRSFNLRSALKRYTDYSKIFGNNELYVEPFSFYSKRGTNSTVLGYETYGGGLNLIYPLKNRKTDLILSLGHSELDLKGDHDLSRNNFLAGINSRDLGTLGKFKFSGFFVGGMEWHEGSREIFTNTTTTGKADVTSDFTSYELITGGQFNYHHNNIAKTTWNTEVGFTFGSSFTPEYNERGFFAWGDRHLVQGSVHVSEQLITRINKKLAVRVGGEFEYRTVLTGRTQSYSINGTLVKSKSGNFNEKAVSVRVGTHYAMNDNSLAYVNVDGRISDNATRGTYGLSAGIKLNF